MITPNEEVANGLFFKREDMHPLGSHKGRSIPIMIDAYERQGFKKFSLSSSGNAALAAAKYIKNRNLSLEIFIGKKIPEGKKNALTALADNWIKTSQTERPLQKFLETIKINGVKGLRQSTDNTALIGYGTLAEEIALIPNLLAIFIATSSGTTAQALGEFFFARKNSPQIHIVQTSSCRPIAEIFDPRKDTGESSIADAIVDKVAHRREKVAEIVKKTGGFGWIVTNEEIKKAQEKMAPFGVVATPNGALSYAGYLRAISQGRKFTGSVLCIIGGK